MASMRSSINLMHSTYIISELLALTRMWDVVWRRRGNKVNEEKRKRGRRCVNGELINQEDVKERRKGSRMDDGRCP